jgi:simple sugar transport system ATP-binding protein
MEEKRLNVDRFSSHNFQTRRADNEARPMMDVTDILSVKGITKSFPGVLALEGVDFSLKKGEIHALMGENGAGKSTLIKIVTGVEHPDQGSIEFDGRLVEVRSPQAAQTIGISTVYQEVNLCI